MRDRFQVAGFPTLVHELAHEMLHRDERRNGTSKRVRETEAEAVSFVVCNAIGLEAGTAAQDYIQLYEGDAKLLTESLDRIQQTANRILNFIGAEAPSALPAWDAVSHPARILFSANVVPLSPAP